MLFQSGQTFTAPSASDALTIKGVGTATNPIVFGIYGGSTPAIISQASASKNGITFSTTNAYITVQDLQVAGPFAWERHTTGATSPYGIYLQGPASGTPLTGITIQRVQVHNFIGSGIRTPVKQEVANLSITDTQVYQVGDAGIRIGDDTDTQGAQIHTNIYIGNCQVYDTSGFNASALHHGDGILVQCAKTVTIEYCTVHDTATAFSSTGSGGPYGIWLADTAFGTIQHSESYNNSNGTLSIDGGGFDLDGGTQYCVIQYCYAHDNDGPGYLQAHWATSSETASTTINNTFRYNISVNDSKHCSQAALSFFSANAAATLNNSAYNNLVVQARSTGTNACLDQFDSTVGTAAGPSRFYNNIFVSDYSHLLANTVNSTHYIIDKNIWWSLTGTFTYSGGSLAATDTAGIQADPMINGEPSAFLTAPTVGYANIDIMPQVLASQFEELPGSPATDAGLTLSQAAYGSLSVGSQDFFGTSIPQNTTYDIGPSELSQSGPSLSDGSFETPSVGTAGSQYNPTGSAWTFTSNAGIQGNGSTWGAPTAPNGTQTAFLEGKNSANGTISQAVNFPAAGTFEVCFQSALRTSTASQTFNVQIDGTTVGTFTPSSGTFTSFATTAFVISSAGSHTLTFVGSGTGADATDFIDDVSIASLPATPVSVPWTDSHIQYSGRFDTSRPDCTQFSYSASSITASFTGTSLTAFLSGPEQYFRVILDGHIQGTLLEIIPGTQSYSVVSGLAAGMHTVTLVKLNEPNLTLSANNSQVLKPTSSTNAVQFSGFQLDPGQGLLTPPSLPAKRIEVIGDSVTCGYGNLAPSGTSGYNITQEDGYYAYGADAARSLGADYHAVAWSGGYLYPVSGGYINLPGIYTDALPQTTTPWTFSNWLPQVVVINLGTNDFGVFYPNYPFTEAQWVSAYTSFIATIRANNPSAIIYCMVGPMLGSGAGLADCETYTKQVVSTMNTNGDANVRYFEVPFEGGNQGADDHPNEAEDATVGSLLANQIQTDLSWPVGTAPAITSQPSSSIVTAGQLVSFSVTASGTGPFTYQWLKNGYAISGATGSTYTIASPSASDGGTYSVVVTNAYGFVTGSSFSLTVNPAPAGSTDTPTMPQWALIVMACLLVMAASRRRLKI